MSKIDLTTARDIALDKLVASGANVRRINAGVSVEEEDSLAENTMRRRCSTRSIPGFEELA